MSYLHEGQQCRSHSRRPAFHSPIKPPRFGLRGVPPQQLNKRQVEPNERSTE